MSIFARIAMALAIGTTALAQSPAKVGNTTLVGRYWKAIEVAGKPVPVADPKREAHLVFQAGNRVSGSDGCNRFTGSDELKGDAIAISQLAGTQMACVNIGDIDRTFRDVLKRTTRVTAAADRLQFSDATGTRLAVSLPSPRQRIWPEPLGSLSTSEVAMGRR